MKFVKIRKEDIKEYLKDRNITKAEVMKKHNISRNTLIKYIDLVKAEGI